MKAVGFKANGPIEAENALEDIEIAKPAPEGLDILVEVKAISVNPVDCKVRQSRPPKDGKPEVLGYDAAGTVVAIGADVASFKIGDDVFYAGSIIRPGTNAQFHLVDERIVGKKPRESSFAESAAMPLTSLTAWEILFDRIDVTKPVAGGANAILIIGGAGGVSSIAIQLMRQMTDLTVIATASRPETDDWVKKMGAHHVINHREPLGPQVAALNIGAPSFVFSTNQTSKHGDDIAELIAPQGRFGLIDDIASVASFKTKAVSIHWESMFTRSMFETADMSAQGDILNEVSRLMDDGKLLSTMNTELSPINAENLIEAHKQSEKGATIGKIVLSDFSDQTP